MNLNRLAGAAVIAAGVVLSATSGVGLAAATPPVPVPAAPAMQPDPGGPAPGIPAEKCWRYGRSGGGNPRGGGGVPGFLPPCPAAAPIEGQ